MTDAESVIAFFDREMGSRRTFCRVVQGFEPEVLDDVVTHYDDKNINVVIEPRNEPNSFWVTLTRR